MLKEQSKKEKIMLTIAVILMTIGFINSIKVLLTNKLNVINIGTTIEYVLIIIYATILYKKPHGNLLKILIMIYGFVFAYFAIDSYQSDTVSAILSAAVVVLVCFMDGRLDRYQQNVKISIIVLLVLFVMAGKDSHLMNASKDAPREINVMQVADPNASEMPDEMELPADIELMEPAVNEASEPPVFKTILANISFLNMSIMWTAIFFGYCSRYRQHKEAGLLDK